MTGLQDAEEAARQARVAAMVKQVHTDEEQVPKVNGAIAGVFIAVAILTLAVVVVELFVLASGWFS